MSRSGARRPRSEKAKERTPRATPSYRLAGALAGCLDRLLGFTRPPDGGNRKPDPARGLLAGDVSLAYSAATFPNLY